jgi:hypothetical protein
MLRRAPLPDDTTLQKNVITLTFETLFGMVYTGTGEVEEQEEMQIASVTEMRGPWKLGPTTAFLPIGANDSMMDNLAQIRDKLDDPNGPTLDVWCDDGFLIDKPHPDGTPSMCLSSAFSVASLAMRPQSSFFNPGKREMAHAALVRPGEKFDSRPAKLVDRSTLTTVPM